jgi:hypothetical protein
VVGRQPTTRTGTARTMRVRNDLMIIAFHTSTPWIHPRTGIVI